MYFIVKMQYGSFKTRQTLVSFPDGLIGRWGYFNDHKEGGDHSIELEEFTLKWRKEYPLFYTLGFQNPFKRLWRNVFQIKIKARSY